MSHDKPIVSYTTLRVDHMTEKAPILKSGLNRQGISVPSKPPPDLVGTILMIDLFS